MRRNSNRNMEIYNLRKQGEPIVSIGKKYGLTKSSIYEICHRIERRLERDKYIKQRQLDDTIAKMRNVSEIYNSTIDGNRLDVYINNFKYDREVINIIKDEFNIKISNNKLDENYFIKLDKEYLDYNYKYDAIKRLEPYGFISDYDTNINIAPYININTISELCNILEITDNINNYKREDLICKLEDILSSIPDIPKLIDALILYLNNKDIIKYDNVLKPDILERKIKSCFTDTFTYMNSLYALFKLGHLNEFVKPIDQNFYRSILSSNDRPKYGIYHDKYEIFTNNLNICKNECNIDITAPIGFPQFLLNSQRKYIITPNDGVYIDLIELNNKFKINTGILNSMDRYKYFCIYKYHNTIE